MHQTVMPKTPHPPISSHPIDHHILVVRGHKVMIDSDLAALYQVPTKVFNQAVRRNLERFPQDFMFHLTDEEAENLRSQTVTSSWGGHRYNPTAFTEHGVAMLSAILRSERAVQMSIAIIRSFVRLRALVASNKDIAARVDKLERSHDRTASVIEILVDDIDHLADDLKQMKALPKSPKRKIGFDL